MQDAKHSAESDVKSDVETDVENGQSMLPVAIKLQPVILQKAKVSLLTDDFSERKFN